MARCYNCVPKRLGAHLFRCRVASTSWRGPSNVHRTIRICAQQWEQNFEPSSPAVDNSEVALEPRADDVLPDNLLDSLSQAASCTATALSKGVCRATIEILLPEFWDPISGPVFAEEGDQMRFWQLTKQFTDNLVEMSGKTNVTVVYPDMGVAASLKHQWGDIAFTITSLNDRIPLTGNEDLVILAAPDPPGQSDCVRVNRLVPEDVPLVLFNPRLASGDVGIGLSVRRMREQFLGQFVTTYSIRPIGDIGTVFRTYPDMWRVFIQDENMPGRYKRIAERPDRPAGDALDYIITEALDGEKKQDKDGGNESGLLQNVGRTLMSVQRFMRSLSN